MKTDAEFGAWFMAAVKSERKCTNVVLRGILEAEDRKYFAKRGFNSLFAWLVKDVGYSEGSAGRRIASARLLRSMPSVEERLEKGEVSLSTLSQVKTAIREHTKKTGEKVSLEEQEQLVENISHKTFNEVQETLFERFPETASSVHQERETIIAAELYRIAFNFDKAAMDDLKWAKDFYAHIYPDGENAEIFARLLRDLRKREDKKGERAVAKMESQEVATTSKNGAAHSESENHRVKTSKQGGRRVTLHRVQRKCEFVDPVTGRVCGSSYMVEVDHIKPRALGGEDHVENYRCLCRVHNQLEAERKLGEIYDLRSWRRG